MKNIRDLKRKDFIEKNTNKLKIGLEYLLGYYFFVKDKEYVSSITRINKDTYTFKHYKKDILGNLYEF